MSNVKWLICILGTILLINAPAGAYEFRVNVGDGRVYTPVPYTYDAPYTVERGYGHGGGNPWEYWMAVGGCPNDSLYRTLRHNCNSYRFDVPNGAYLVTMHFSDAVAHRCNDWTVSWYCNGVRIYDHLDIYAEVGREYAVAFRFPVEVTSGAIFLDEVRHDDRSELAALEVVSHDPDGIAPAAPVFSAIHAGFDQVWMNWEDNAEEDLRGYSVYRQELPAGPVECVFEARHLVSRYVDLAVEPGVSYQYWITAVDVFGNESEQVGPFEATPRTHASSTLPVVYIDIDPDSLYALNADPEEDIYYTCAVTLGDSTYSAGLRYRGNVVRKLSKKSYKIRLYEDRLFEGRRKLNCNAEMCDPVLMRESISLDLFADAGVPSPRTWWRSLVLNGENMGTYCDVEQVDAMFLEARPELDRGANIYKCFDRLVALPDSAAYQAAYEKETNEEGSWGDLITFIETLNQTPNDEFYEAFIDLLDIDEYLRYFAILRFIQDGDAVVKNFYLYHDLDTGIWKILPWDKDLSWGITWLFRKELSYSIPVLSGVYSGGNYLTYRMFTQPIFKNMLASLLYELLTEDFPLAEINARIDAAHLLTEENGTLDYRKWYWEENERLQAGDEELRGFASQRYPSVLGQLPGMVSPQELYINEFMAQNNTTITDEFGEYEDWIEIYNPGPDSVNLGEYYLTDRLEEPVQWALPDTMLAPESCLLIWADNDGWQGPLHAGFKLSADGELIALHKEEETGGTYPGPDDIDPIDLVFFGPQTADRSRGRIFDADYRWTYPESPSPGVSNGTYEGVAEESARLILGTRLQTHPNPFRERISMSLGGEAPGGALEIYDVQGRLCRRFEPRRGQSEWVWDGRLPGGELAPPGNYWARVRIPGQAPGRASRILLVR